jgi:anti-sigma factor RsiW
VTCPQVDDRLDAWLQGRLSRTEVAALEEHLDGCAACRALVEDARLLQREARLIGTEGPPAGAWDRLADRLQQQADVRRVATTMPPGAGGMPWRWVAVAAALTLVIGASLFVLRQSLFSPEGSAPAKGEAVTAPATPATLVESIELELDQAAQHYERAIAGLEQVATESDSPLDAAVTATLRENLQIIDRAIDDSREALRSEPNSQLAQESLFDAFRRKVALLQDTIALMNEMRKGNQAGAAAIASGLNKG